MDDHHAEDAERFKRLLAGSRHRWHPAPDDHLLFVLDDGTGDVELRVRPSETGIEATLIRLDCEVERWVIPTNPGIEDDAFLAGLDEAVARQSSGRSSDGSKGRTRFIVSFDPAQLEGLRDVAEQADIPVAEVVRRAVNAYLAKGGSPAGPAGG